jgi:hypothetical protein
MGKREKVALVNVTILILLGDRGGNLNGKFNSRFDLYNSRAWVGYFS